LQEYNDVDYNQNKVEKKSTSRGRHFIGGNLILWMSKKQGTIALSTTKVEYISAAQCCSQLLYIRNQFVDYEIHKTNISIFCDNSTFICLSKNPYLYSKSQAH